jgi:hypothetical protein
MVGFLADEPIARYQRKLESCDNQYRTLQRWYEDFTQFFNAELGDECVQIGPLFVK